MSYLDKNGLQHYHDEAVKPLIQEMPNKVDKPHYKNLINPANTTGIYTQSSGETGNAGSAVSYWFECTPYTDYTITKATSEQFVIGGCNQHDTAYATCELIFTNTKINKAVVNSKQWKYLIVTVRKSGAGTMPEWIQAEIGTTATEYVAYGTETHDEAYALKTDGGLMRVDDVIASLQAQVDALKPKTWIKKATMTGNTTDRGNIDTGVTVDFNDCTEFIVKGTIVSSGNPSLKCTHGNILPNIPVSGTSSIVVRYIDDALGISPVVAKVCSGVSNVYPNQLDAYARTDKKIIKNITQFTWYNSSIVTECNLEIWAR